MRKQIFLYKNQGYEELDQYLASKKIEKIFLVCGHSIEKLKLNSYFLSLENRMGIKVIRFSDFVSNPTYESVKVGVDLFRNENCQTIIAVGGGSAIDVAKCIKLFANMNSDISYLEQEIIENNIFYVAVPTTAGTGSEATSFAVIYKDGKKVSIADESCIPSIVLFDPSVLEHLPLYQRKVTMLDAMCHTIESLWSVNSTAQSRKYAKEALQMICKFGKAYIDNDAEGNEKMQQASFIAGKAINISKTTAGHAMSYILTEKYGIAHGHAVAICLSELWPYMYSHMDDCIDPRGKVFLNNVFVEIASCMGCSDIWGAIDYYKKMLVQMGIDSPRNNKLRDTWDLVKEVNVERLKNNPIKLSEDVIRDLYNKIIR